jgi:hypothetical protein
MDNAAANFQYLPLRGGGAMAIEMETATAASLGGFFRRRAKHALPLGAPCANCATPLAGPWCHACGQLGEDFHRSTFKLIGEAFEGVLHIDGRLWKTLPDLFLHPARLTRAYLDGHRAPQIPPLRLFLVVLLMVFFAAALGGRGVVVHTTTSDDQGHVLSNQTRTFDTLSAEDREKVKAALGHAKVEIGQKPDPNATEWFKARLVKALDDPERFKLVLEQWSERFAFLTLPLAAALLSLVFVFQRRFYVFDHTIFSLHSLSAVGLMFALGAVFSRPTDGRSYWILLAAPVHLFLHMRGVYGTSILGTLLRMFLIWFGSVIGACFIVVGLLWVGLSGMA